MNRLDPAVKLLAAIVLALGVAWADSWLAWVAVSAVIAACYILSAVTYAQWLRYAKPVLVFAVLAAFLGQGSDGRALVQVGGYTYTTGDAVAGICTGSRLVALVTAVIWIPVVMPSWELAAALSRLLAPLRYLGLATDDLVTAITLALRFFPLARAEARDIRLAQQARGVCLLPPLYAAWQQVAGYTIPLLAGVLRRSDTLAASMVLRGYRRGQAWPMPPEDSASAPKNIPHNALAVAVPAMAAVISFFS